MFRRNIAIFDAAAATTAVGSYPWCKDRMNLGIGRGHNLMLEKGKGTHVWDTEGKKYIDFASGIGAGNLGHCHPRLVKVVQKQAGELWHAPVAFGIHTAMRDMLIEFEKILPKELNNFMINTTGAEAVESALKIARQATGRQNTVVMNGGYHGRTVATAAMTMSKSIYARNMRPLMPGVFGIPVPYASQLAIEDVNTPTEEMVEMAFKQAVIMMNQQSHPSEIAMMIAEPVLGEGGYYPLPTSYLKKLQQYCKENGILFVMDEVQSGFGRTGSFFTCLDVGIVPDMIIFAKGFANGLPISGVVCKKELSDKCLPGTMGGTYAGNVLAASSATEVIKVMQEEKIFENVAARNKQFITGLKAMTIKNKFPVQEIRGRGLMLALQMLPHIPAGTTGKIVDACTKRGLIIMNTSLFETIRLIPPLNVSEEELTVALAIMEEAMIEVFTGLGDALNKTPPGDSSAKGGWSFLPCCSAEDSCQKSGEPCRHIAQQ